MSTALRLGGVKLYELAEARDILDAWLLEAEGEETPELAQLLEQLAGDVDQKGERIALWIREKEREVEALRVEEKFLAAKRQARERAIERSKEYFLGLLEQLNKKEIGTAIAKLCRQSSGQQLEGELTAEQLAKLPAAFYVAATRHIPSKTELDRKKALALLQQGATIDGLKVVEAFHIRIR